jgi:protein-tyrosine phosphatase
MELDHLGGEDLGAFGRLGIRTVFDMRTESERAAQPDVIPEGTEQLVCDMLKDSQSRPHPRSYSRSPRSRDRAGHARRRQGCRAVRAGPTGRSGWAAAATLLLLGVSQDDVFSDYELTNRDLVPALKPVLEYFRAVGGDPDLLKPVLGVDPDYLRASLDEMHQHFGSIDSYFADGLGLGIDAHGQQVRRYALTD